MLAAAAMPSAACEPSGRARKIPAVDGAVGLRQQPHGQRLFGFLRGIAAGIELQCLLDVKERAVALRIDEAAVAHALRGQLEQGAHLVLAALGSVARARRGLRGFHLLARFGELRRQERDAAALDSRFARRFDRGRRFVEPFLEQGVFGPGQQTFVDFREAGAGRRIRGILRLRLQYSSSALSPAGSVSRLAAERRGGGDEQRRFGAPETAA